MVVVVVFLVVVVEVVVVVDVVLVIFVVVGEGFDLLVCKYGLEVCFFSGVVQGFISLDVIIFELLERVVALISLLVIFSPL